MATYLHSYKQVAGDIADDAVGEVTYRDGLKGGPVLLSNSRALPGRKFSQPRAHLVVNLCTETANKDGTWLREISSCCCLTTAGKPRQLLLKKIYNPFFPSL